MLCLLVVQFNTYAGEDPKKNKKKSTSSLKHIKTIVGRISPKSVVHNSKGLFFAQNMMYRHTVTVYDRSFNLVKTIRDDVMLSEYGFDEYKSKYKGAPVECAFSPDGEYAWVSNYEMRGGNNKEFNHPGCDGCVGTKYDNSYVYKINTKDYSIDAVVEVGAVPKYVAVTPNNRLVLVSNWTSGDLSVIDTRTNKEIKRVKLGRLPRGIVVNSKSTHAYVAIMGSNKIAKVNLFNYNITWIKKVGRGPRHLCISPDDKYLYVSINNEGKVVRIDLDDYSRKKVRTGRNPRSMTLSDDGKYLYVVNYTSNTLSKVEAKSMSVVQEKRTNSKPIGITFDGDKKNVWVACYTGRIMVFHDADYDTTETMLLANRERTNDFSYLSFQYLDKKPVSKTLTLREIAEVMSERTSVIATKEPAKTKRVVVKKETKKVETKTVRKRTKKKTVSKSKSKKRTVKKKAVESKSIVTKGEVSRGYYLITGAFGSERNAKKYVRIQQKRGYENARIISGQKNGLYNVAIDGFGSRDEARKFKAKKKVKAWVLKVK